MEVMEDFWRRVYISVSPNLEGIYLHPRRPRVKSGVVVEERRFRGRRWRHLTSRSSANGTPQRSVIALARPLRVGDRATFAGTLCPFQEGVLVSSPRP